MQRFSESQLQPRTDLDRCDKFIRVLLNEDLFQLISSGNFHNVDFGEEGSIKVDPYSDDAQPSILPGGNEMVYDHFGHLAPKMPEIGKMYTIRTICSEKWAKNGKWFVPLSPLPPLSECLNTHMVLQMRCSDAKRSSPFEPSKYHALLNAFGRVSEYKIFVGKKDSTFFICLSIFSEEV